MNDEEAAQRAKRDREVFYQGLTGLGFLLMAACVIGWQVLGYLEAGLWTPFSLIDAAALISSEPWLRTPTSWFGLHAVLAWVPVSGTLAVLAYWIIVAEK